MKLAPLALRVLGAVLLIAGCTEKDLEAPPAPFLDPIAAKTYLPSVIVSGSAEYGSKISITGGTEEVATVADKYTARFRAEVKLKPAATSSLSVTATDAAGNTSVPATADVIQLTPKPDSLTVSVDPRQVAADDGEVLATARLSASAEIADLSGFAVVFTSSAPGVTSQTVKADAKGVATATLKGLNKAGSYTVTAVADTNPGATGNASFSVKGGGAKTITMTLSANGGATPLPEPIIISVGDTLSATLTVSDSFGNALGSAPIVLSSNIPNSLVEGTKISSIGRSGTFRVSATVLGTAVSIAKDVTVKPGDPAALSFTLSGNRTRAGVPVGFTVKVSDAAGNEITDAAVVVKPAACPATGACVLLSSTPALTSPYNLPCSDPASPTKVSQGFIGKTFVAVDLAGVAGANNTFTLTAELDKAVSPLKLTQALVVEAGPAARFGTRSPTASGFTLTDPAPAGAVQAGEDAPYSYAVTDASCNPTIGPVSVFTDAPGSRVVDDGISGQGAITNLNIARATPYKVKAYIPGVTTPFGPVSLLVGTAAPATVQTSQTAGIIPLTGQVTVFATVRDAFGNAIDCPTTNPTDPVPTAALGTFPGLTLDGNPTTNVTAAGPATCSASLFKRTFSFSKEGSYAIDVTYKSSPAVTGSAYVTVLGFDTVPPTVHIKNVTVVNTVCTPTQDPASCDVRPGNAVDFDVDVSDNISLSQVSFSAFFSSVQRQSNRTVLLGNNVKTSLTHFRLFVPGGALPERVALVAQATDGAGNLSSSPEVILNVILAAQGFAGRTLTTLATGGAGNPLTLPNDVGAMSTGDILVLNDDGPNSNILKIDKTTGAVSVVKALGQPPSQRYLALDPTDKAFFGLNGGGDPILRLDTAGALTTFVNTGGRVPRGLQVVGAIPGRGFVQVTAALVAGDTLTLGPTATRKVFEFQTAGTTPNGTGCAATSDVCVKIEAGNIPGTHANLAALILSQPVIASLLTKAVVTPAGNAVALEAKVAGDANALFLISQSAGNHLNLNGQTGATTLLQGRDPQLYMANTNDTNLYRFSLTGTPPLAPNLATDGIGNGPGGFNLGDRQWGFAVKDRWGISFSDQVVGDLAVYFIPDGNRDTLRGTRLGISALGSPPNIQNTGTFGVFTNVNQTTGGSSFNRLWDVALTPAGCLLVSDQGNGNVYSVDFRANGVAAAPATELVASGFNDVRGIALDGVGNLLITDRGSSVVYRLAPLGGTNCF